MFNRPLPTRVLSAAILLACGQAVSAQTVEFRIIEREGQTAITDAADTQLNLAVQGRVVGGPVGTALGHFEFNLAMSGEPEAFGTLSRGLISNLDHTYATTIGTSATVGRGGLAAQYTYLAGLNPNFNGVINISSGSFTNTPDQEIGFIFGEPSGPALLNTPGLDSDGDGTPDTYPGSCSGAPLDPAVSPTYFGVGGGWIDVYRFRYTVTNLSPRSLQFEVRSPLARTFTSLMLLNGIWGPLDQTIRSVSAQPTVIMVSVGNTGSCCTGNVCTVVPSSSCGGTFYAGGACAVATCCPANFNHVNGLNIADIFDFLTAWFAHDLSADFTHDSALTTADIFQFLTDWFAGCS